MGMGRRAMSFLTPLYALGLLAVAAPIIFHLIRRSPRGEVPFSSLMFLTPTPPRLTRRSRLEHWLLLVLRATALILLAMAFMRPFLRQEALVDLGEAGGQRIAVLIDTSASMRRADLWPRARAIADEVIAGCRPSDRLAVSSFDASTRPLLGFEESGTLDSARRQAIARARLASLEPTWGSTNLGRALIDTVAAIEDLTESGKKSATPGRIVLISDLQQGSRLEALGELEWPRDVDLDVRLVSHDGSNAGVHALPEGVDTEPEKADPHLRVRVSNDVGSRRESFELSWVDEQGGESGKSIPVYVPPGESRVVRVPQPPGASVYLGLRLKGDVHGFDNRLFLAAEPRREETVLYIGADRADDPTGILYYLNRVYPETPRRIVRVQPVLPTSELVLATETSLPLVILAGDITSENVGRLRKFVQDGGTLLYVIGTPGSGETLSVLAGTPSRKLDEAAPSKGALLGEIAFDHPLFAPLAGAQFNDFTKIRFWKYRRVGPDILVDARVLARFDNGDPAMVEKNMGRGRLVILASGWAPGDSQLARSSKFFPLMAALLEGPNPRRFDATSRLVHDRVRLPERELVADKGLVIIKPDGSKVELASNTQYFDGTDLPGIYKVQTAGATRAFEVNLDPLESKTSPFSLETLEQLGCRLANHRPNDVDPQRLRQMQNMELEGRQKLWRWLIVAAIGTLIVETLLAGKSRKPRPIPVEAST
jgi:hypothetical protein